MNEFLKHPNAKALVRAANDSDPYGVAPLATELPMTKPKKTFFVEILCWIEADSEAHAREAAEARANMISGTLVTDHGPSRLTSATVNCVEEQERVL